MTQLPYNFQRIKDYFKENSDMDNFDILEKKLDALRQEQLEKAKTDPHLASQLLVTGLFPEIEGYTFPYKPATKSKENWS